MNKIFYLLIFSIFLSSCSLNKNSKFWTTDIIKELETKKFQKIFADQEALKEELNVNVSLNLKSKITKDELPKQLSNNEGQTSFNGSLKKSSKYKFSKIKNFYQFEPEISFNKDNLIFFDNKGSILQFDNRSRLLWKKNYYTKPEKKLNPILQFANNNTYLVVADSIAKYYMLDLRNGNLIWSKNSSAPFNSQLKIESRHFFI